MASSSVFLLFLAISNIWYARRSVRSSEKVQRIQWCRERWGLMQPFLRKRAPHFLTLSVSLHIFVKSCILYSSYLLTFYSVNDFTLYFMADLSFIRFVLDPSSLSLMHFICLNIWNSQLVCSLTILRSSLSY